MGKQCDRERGIHLEVRGREFSLIGKMDMFPTWRTSDNEGDADDEGDTDDEEV